MKLSQKDRKLRNKLYVAFLIAGIVLYGLYCFALTPIYIATKSDIAYNTIVPDMLHFVGRILEILAISCFCATVIYGVYHFGASNFVGGYLIFCGMALYKYTANVAVDWIGERSIPVDFWKDLLFAVAYAFIEIAPYVITFFVVRGIIKGYHEELALLKKAGKEKKPLPFDGLFGFSNCLLSSSFACAVTVLVTKFGGQLIYDLQTAVRITNLPLMILDYSTNIIFAALCYFVIILVISIFGQYFEEDGAKHRRKKRTR